jgi:hypothetical protein
VIFIDKKKTEIHLQDGETVDYRYFPYSKFKQFIATDDFVHLIRQRFLAHKELFDAFILQR